MAGLNHDEVQQWLDAYVAAWRSNQPDDVAALFTADATYSYSPLGPAARGVAEIVEDWVRDADDPGSWEAEYEPLAVAGDTAFATGETRYADGRTYANLFVLRFEDGRCASFTDWYMEHPPDFAAD